MALAPRSPFNLEALEPRLLLSGDGALGTADLLETSPGGADPSETSDTVSTVSTPDPSESNSTATEEAQGSDLFDGLTPEALENSVEEVAGESSDSSANSGEEEAAPLPEVLVFLERGFSDLDLLTQQLFGR